MLFAIIGEDTPGSLPKRMAARPDHLARIDALQDEGRLVLAGPFPAIPSEDPGEAGFTGSIIIAEFDSLEAAEAWAAADPYAQTGVYVKTEVRPFRQTRPA